MSRARKRGRERAEGRVTLCNMLLNTNVYISDLSDYILYKQYALAEIRTKRQRERGRGHTCQNVYANILKAYISHAVEH